MTHETAGSVVETDRVHGWLRETLYGAGGTTGAVARVLARPAGAVWERFARRRTGRGHAGAPLPRPVISVGNVTIGGGGKTSLVQWVLRSGLPDATRVAVLARGYRRRGREVLVGVPDGPPVDPETFGDEPALHVRAGAPVGVAADRRMAADAVLAATPIDLFLLDDGLQTRVPRDLDLVIFSARDLAAPARCIPAGPLRQPSDALPERAAWISTGGDPTARPWPRNTIGMHLSSWWEGLPGTTASWIDAGTCDLEAWREGRFSAMAVTGLETVVIAGVANPRSVSSFAVAAGHDVVRLHAFPDHHRFERREIERLVVRSGEVQFVTTEKDAIKLRSEWFGPRPVGVLRRRLVPDDEALLRRLISGTLAGDR